MGHEKSTISDQVNRFQVSLHNILEEEQEENTRVRESRDEKEEEVFSFEFLG